jgi:HEAT repeat protein
VLYRLLNDRSVRTVVVVTIGEMGSKAEVAVPRLMPLLQDTNPWTRAMTAGALGRVGPGAKDAVPALVKALKDQNPLVRYYASEALKRVDPDAAIRAGLRSPPRTLPPSPPP